ncbi:MAG: hypothetical protein MJ208_01220 [Bacilli bacterium]|nr:hypothetical protein [Bacilli bacterium]
MNKKFKVIFAICSIALLTGCSLEVNPEGAAIMTAVNYNGDERIVYSLDDDFQTPNGRKLNKGDYKPVWAALQNRLGINLLEHQPAANSGEKKSVSYFRDNWMTKTYADMSMGTVYDINNYSVAGNRETILDLRPYIEETQFIEVDDPKHPGEKIEIVDPDHKGPLPNIAKFLNDNPGVKMSIITAKHSHPDQGAIYFVPFCDGFNEIDRAIIMRADYVRRLLDDDPKAYEDVDAQYAFSTNKKILGGEGSDAKYIRHYEPCYENEGLALEYTVTVPVEEGGKWTTKEFTKNPNCQNIITAQNFMIDNNQGDSKNLAVNFRAYIDKRYGKPKNAGGGDDALFKNYSDLFLGYNACYDSDELVALMRLVKVSSGTLFKRNIGQGRYEGIEKEMITMMPRACDNQRSNDIYRWAAQVFGVKGPESRNLYLYINGIKDYSEYGYGKYGAVHDARGSKDMLWLLNKLRSLYQEGLILQDFDSKTATGSSEGKFADETMFSGGSDNFASFMVYDWPRDLNDCNKYRTAERKDGDLCNWQTESPNRDPEVCGDKGYNYDLRAVVGAVAQWDTDGNGERETFMPFTESWVSLKTSALCLNARLPDNQEKLNDTLKFIDYIYSPEGMFLYNYGPWEDGYITQMAGDYKTYPDGVYTEGAEEGKDYIMYQGERFPCLTPEALREYKSETGKTGYQRRFVGAGIPFGCRKLSSVTYQTLEPKTQYGLNVVNKAVELETFKHVLIGGYTEQQKEDIKIPFYQICPSAFFLTKGQSSAISSLLDKNTLGSMFSDASTSNFSIWDALIMGEETRLGVTLENYLDKMKEWKVEKLETYYQDAYEIMTEPLEEPSPTK